ALGCSCDWERERFTMDEGLSNAVKEVFVRLYEEGFIYYGERLVNWCPRCMTTLSDLEVEREEQEAQIYFIRYPLAEGKGFITIATTRPETMLADTGVAVHPDDKRYQELIGKSVILPLMNRKIPIVGDEAVDREFGTGALKVTPGHDPIDFEIGRRHGLKIISIFNRDATTNDEAGTYAKLDRYVARERVVEGLRSAGLLDRIEKHKYAVGHCQRCNTVVEPLLSPQWFMRMEELAKPAIKAVETDEVEFIPDRWEKIYFDWMLNIREWPISRQLWWGHRIPAWHCADCHEITVAREVPAKCAKCSSSQHRARYHLFLGRAHDYDGPAFSQKNPVPKSFLSPDHQGREGPEDEQVQGQRHRPFGDERRVRDGRATLHARRAHRQGQGDAPRQRRDRGLPAFSE
ncbi:class I tRNA ligase family protein, partial [Candidatus Acetothermia bacterium]|nr:class I tRNA ligase family protein [Candidatus Acetothermia bacterium]